jgi:hypothetical protein
MRDMLAKAILKLTNDMVIEIAPGEVKNSIREGIREREE